MKVDYFCQHNRALVGNLLARNLKVKYRQSVVGFLWTLLVPLGISGVYYFVFYKFFKVQTPHYLVFIMSGLIPWAFFAETLTEGQNSLVENLNLLSNAPIPIQTFPLAIALTNTATLLLSFPILVLMAFFSTQALTWAMLSYFPLVLLLFSISYALSIILGMLYVHFRDLKHLWQIVVLLWFFLTPILFSKEMIPSQYHWVVAVNPVGLLFEMFHTTLVYGKWPALSSIFISLAWAITLGLLAYYCLRKFASKVVEKI